MTRRSVVIWALILALALAGGLYWQCRVNTDSRQIRKALRSLVDRAQLEAREDALKAGVRSRAIGNAFTEDVAVTTPVFQQHIADRPSLVALVFRARTNLDSIRLTVHDVEVEVADDRVNATMILSFNVKVAGMGGSDEMWRDVEMGWRKDEGDWRIATAEIIETIRRPQER